MTWREKSQEVIRETCLIWLDITHVTPNSFMTEKEKKELMRMVDKSYPFGDRSMFPYKAWLKERRHLTDQLWPEKKRERIQKQLRDHGFMIGQAELEI